MAIEVISKIKQKNNADFPLMDAKDVELNDGRSVEEALQYIEATFDVASNAITGLDDVKTTGAYNVKINLMMEGAVAMTYTMRLDVGYSTMEGNLHMQFLTGFFIITYATSYRQENPDGSWGEWQSATNDSGIDNLRDRVTTLESNFSDHEYRISTLEGSIQNLENNIFNIENTANDANALAQANSTEIINIQNELSNITAITNEEINQICV